MRIWTSEHTFQHPWETVVNAAWQKYPNPITQSVVGVDIVDRYVDRNGVLKTHRLLSTSWGLQPWVTRIVGIDRTCFASEISEVDPRSKRMTLQTRNLTFCNIVSIDENLTYCPDPKDKSSTLLKQEAIVNVKGIPLSSYLEGILTDTISNNAGKGRQAMEWVIGKLKGEAKDLTEEAKKCMDSVLPTNHSTATSL
ncbi:Hypothetical predicted protein [Octopus vulgaris]|uniref:Uncharacterized protein n=2 Tax=Octopus TaxID=6643 RepID=A0AA36AH18_OCTVU|nr:PRELI domain containing protein 3B [Octopus sinensis]CAI9715998.1 Hypothetical predicted protein [Octopus vulgaris]